MESHVTTRFTTDLVYFLGTVYQRVIDTVNSNVEIDRTFVYWYLELALNLMKPFFYTKNGHTRKHLEKLGLTEEYLNVRTKVQLQKIEIHEILEYILKIIDLVKYGNQQLS